MGDGAYYLEQTDRGWGVYVYHDGAKDLFYDSGKVKESLLGLSSRTLTDRQKLFGDTDSKLEELVLKYSDKEALFIKLLGEDEYRGYRPIKIAGTKDIIRNTIRNNDDEGSLINTLTQTVESIEKLVKNQREDTTLFELYQQIETFVANFAERYIVLIEIKTNRDAWWFKQLEQFFIEKVRIMMLSGRWCDAVINHSGTSSVQLSDMKKRCKQLSKDCVPQGYNIEQVFESACEHQSKMVDMMAEYLYYNTFYPAKMRQEQGISIADYWSLAGDVPSFSPVAGFENDQEYGVINATYMTSIIFVSPLERGESKPMMKSIWDKFSESMAKNAIGGEVNQMYFTLKKNNLWI